MHETHLIEPIIQGISEHAKREGAKTVLKVRLAELEVIFFPGTQIEVASFDID
jgi:Zn finger protein HypA/HybF involved in hydrogenase expression